MDDAHSEIARTWQDVQKHIFDWAMEACDFSSARDLPVLSQPGQVILSGLLIMADWISSNEKYFPLLSAITIVLFICRGRSKLIVNCDSKMIAKVRTAYVNRIT